MANKKCQQCAETVKAEAKVCRFCGYNFPLLAPISTNPKMGLGRKIGIGFAMLFGLSMVNAALHNPGGVATTPAAAPTTKPPADPNAIAPALVGMSLKSAARDPDSLIIDHAYQNAKETYVCVEYRAKNGFGGMNREHAVFTRRGGDQSSSTWNRKCTEGSLADVTSQVRFGTSLKTPI